VNEVKEQLSFLPEDEQAEIARRRLICANCPFNSDNAIKEGYKTSRIDSHCILCGCTISRKTASLSSTCGIDCCNAEQKTDCDCKKKNLKEYNVKNNINLTVKWEAYQKENHEQKETGNAD
jgi:hypothetical protein